MRILQKEYDLAPETIQGYDPKVHPKVKEIAHLVRETVVLDADEYTVNDAGEPEMTKEQQEQYDGFIDRIRAQFGSDRWEVIYEGFGEGEDELEYHISAITKGGPEEKQRTLAAIVATVRAE